MDQNCCRIRMEECIYKPSLCNLQLHMHLIQYPLGPPRVVKIGKLRLKDSLFGEAQPNITVWWPVI